MLLLIRGQEKSADTDSVWDGLGVRNPSSDLAMRWTHNRYAKIAFDRVIGESGKTESMKRRTIRRRCDRFARGSSYAVTSHHIISIVVTIRDVVYRKIY